MQSTWAAAESISSTPETKTQIFYLHINSWVGTAQNRDDLIQLYGKFEWSFHWAYSYAVFSFSYWFATSCSKMSQLTIPGKSLVTDYIYWTETHPLKTKKKVMDDSTKVSQLCWWFYNFKSSHNVLLLLFYRDDNLFYQVAGLASSKKKYQKTMTLFSASGNQKTLWYYKEILWCLLHLNSEELESRYCPEPCSK